LDRLEKVHRNGNHLLQMINNILDLSKVEAGEMHVEDEPVDLDEVTGDVLDMLQPQAEAKNLYIHKEFEKQGITTCTDGLKIRQVLVNLVGNGIKFTKTGGVKVSCRLPQDDAEFLHLEVADTGIGIEPEKHEKIFKAFSQADNSTAHEFGGTGLGLTISRSIVHLLGGTLELRSIPGKGSVFRIRLPLRVKNDFAEIHQPIVKKSTQNSSKTA
jgi:signal transduction histidine kinase